MDWIITLGLIAGLFTTTANLPQLIKIYKLKEASDISALTYLLLTAGFILWTIYAVEVQDAPLLIANIFSLVIALGIIMLKVTYDEKRGKNNWI